MTVPLERQKNIADVAPRVREQLGLGSAALSDAGDFATSAQGEKADDALPAGMLPITSSVQGLTAIDLPDGMTAIRTNGFNAMGDLGAWPLAVEVTEDGSALEPWQRQTNGGMRRFELRADVVSVKMFGAKGDGAADDATAIANALAYWKATGCTLVFPQGSYRMASGVVVDLDGLPKVGEIRMEGSIKPDAGIGRAITFRNARGGEYTISVYGGGQTADYTEADPIGGDEAFRFVNCFGGKIAVAGQNYKGRVLRITSDTPGVGGFKTEGILITSMYFDSSAAIYDAEATRLDQGVGQGFFIDTYMPAFGTIEHAWCFWEKYGSVIEDTTDITLHDLESLWRGVSGLELRGVLSFWGGKINIGSEMATGTRPDLLTIKDSATRSCSNINIEQVFAVGGRCGILAENVGLQEGPGLRIGAAFTRLCDDAGIRLSNCRKFDINQHSYGDQIGLDMLGLCWYGTVNLMHTGARRQSIRVSSQSNELIFRGVVVNANRDEAANTPLIQVDTVNPIFFDHVITGCDKSSFLYDIVGFNNTRIQGGRALAAGVTQISDNDPGRVINVHGWVTAEHGIAIIPAGSTSVVVNHGLVRAPDLVFLTGRAPTTASCYVTGITSTQFTINAPSALPDNQPVSWRASLGSAG